MHLSTDVLEKLAGLLVLSPLIAALLTVFLGWTAGHELPLVRALGKHARTLQDWVTIIWN